MYTAFDIYWDKAGQFSAEPAINAVRCGEKKAAEKAYNAGFSDGWQASVKSSSLTRELMAGALTQPESQPA